MMSQELHAIFEHGILRPLTPLDLPEGTRVTVTLHGPTSGGVQSATADPILGLMADEPGLVDQVVEAAMAARESHPLRAPID
jgi:predicted DNA-binding antitoxin AbrB/MazE fold protein